MDTIRYERRGVLGFVHMDDGKANAMDGAFFAALNGALDGAEADKPSAVVVAGRAGFFSGGLNVKTLPTLDSRALGILHRDFAATMARAFLFPIPTVAACTGHAMAGGLILALACDLRFALDGAFRLQMNEVHIGIALPSWVLAITQPAIPPRRRVEVLLHGKPFSPREAVSAGFFDGIVEASGDVVAHAEEAARGLATLHPQAYALSKRRMRGPAMERALALLGQEPIPGEETGGGN